MVVSARATGGRGGVSQLRAQRHARRDGRRPQPRAPQTPAARCGL